MRKEFKMQPGEDLNSYLKRMAPILDAIRNKNYGKLNKELIDSVSAMEIEELNSHLALLTESAVDSAVFNTASRFGESFQSHKDDLKIVLWFNLVNNLHRFNNERYIKLEKEFCPLDRFIKGLTGEAVRTIWREIRNMSEYDIRRENHVKRVIEIIRMERECEDERISAEEIFHNQHKANDAMNLSLQRIKEVLLLMDDTDCWNEDEIDYVPGPDSASDPHFEHGYDMVDNSEGIDMVLSYFSELKDYEKYIYASYLRLRRGQTTTKAISGDSRLVKLCMMDETAKTYVKNGSCKVIRDKNKLNAGATKVLKATSDRYVNDSLIESTYRRVERTLIRSFTEKAFEMDEVEACLKFFSEYAEKYLASLDE